MSHLRDKPPPEDAPWEVTSAYGKRKQISEMPQKVRALSNTALERELNRVIFDKTADHVGKWFWRPWRRNVVQEARRRGILREDPGVKGGDLKDDPW